MRRCNWLCILIVLCLFQTGAVSVLAQSQVTRLPLTQKVLQESLGEEWFGVYLRGKKIGYAKSSLKKTVAGGEPYYMQSMHLKVKAKSSGIPFELDLAENLEFAGKAPFALLRGKSMQQQGTAKQLITLRKSDAGFVAVTVANGKETQSVVGKLDYTLADAMTTSLWIHTKPKKGDSLKALGFDFDRFQTDIEVHSMLDVKKSKVKGVEVTYYEIEVFLPSQNFKMLERIDHHGTMLSGRIGGVFEMRLEPEKVAKNLESNVDLFIMGLVKIDRPLGDPSTVASMFVELLGEEATLIQSGPWQSVQKTEDGRLICKVGKKFGSSVKATAKEIADCLEATSSYPAAHPRIVAMAQKAVGDAKSDEEKVKRLVKFVHEYIRPSYGNKGLVVLDLLDKRTGDCTAYAALFTTLCRASGLPAREVSGFAYMGDTQKAFGGHAWNEVVVDGCWHPVDATTGAFKIDAARICLGSDNQGGVNFLKNFGSLSLRLISVEHNK